MKAKSALRNIIIEGRVTRPPINDEKDVAAQNERGYFILIHCHVHIFDGVFCLEFEHVFRAEYRVRLIIESFSLNKGRASPPPTPRATIRLYLNCKCR